MSDAPTTHLADGTWKLQGLRAESIGFAYVSTAGTLCTTRMASTLTLPLPPGTYTWVHAGDEGFSATADAGDLDDQFVTWAAERVEGGDTQPVHFLRTTAVGVTTHVRSPG